MMESEFEIDDIKIASSSSSHLSSSTVVSSSGSSSYHVFLSFRGRDTRNIFVDHLYLNLVRLGIHTYRDDRTLHKGAYIHPSLMKAIEESQIAVIVFSENYGDSSSCMQELEYIMECKDKRGLQVIPIFYNVVPDDVKKQIQKFGEGFAKQKKKNSDKVESWRKALVAAAEISGWAPKDMANGREGAATIEIVNTIFQRLRLSPIANEKPVGIDARLQDFKSYLNVGSNDVRMIGIWGLGGGGKTTLALYVFKEISDKFDGCCFVGNIREASDKYGLEKLQEKVVSDVLKTQVTAWSVEEGRLMIRSWLCHKKVLIVLDDVACHDHLEALAGSHDWFGEGSLIIITTRDKHLLNAHKVDVTYNINLLDDEESIQLFYRHTLWNSKHEEDHGKLSILSQNVVSYASGLPLALKVLGLFLCDKLDTSELSSTWTRLNDIPDCDLVKKLKVSYDRLKPVEQELFLDITCFFRHWPKDEAMMILDACGFHPVVGVKVLIQNALLSIADGAFDMHDAVQKMGYYIVRGKHTNNPEKHSRVWRYEDIEDMCTLGSTMENNKIQVLYCPDDAPPNLFKVIANLKKLRLINVCQNVKKLVEEPLSLSNGLRWMSWEGYPARSLPADFHPTKLVGLKLKNGLQEKLWTGCKNLPSLKELDLHGSNNLIMTPDFKGLPNLKRLVLSGCSGLKEIHPSIGYLGKLVYLNLDGCKELEMFPPIITMKKLEILILSRCSQLVEFPEIQQTMDGLQHLNVDYSGIKDLPLSYLPNHVVISRICCTNLVKLPLDRLVGSDHKRKRSILVGGDD